MPRFVFLADESGHVTQEPGLSDLIGPSQYLCMAGCLIDLAHCDSIRIALGNLRDEFRKSKNLHATELSHVQKIHLIRKLLELEIPQFGVVSDKRTLRGFKERSGGNPQDYYNRTALYLLSCLGRYMRAKGYSREDVSVVFEERTHDYDRFRNYIRVVQRRPTGDDVDGIELISPQGISTRRKQDEHLLSIPDVAAHALFSAFDRNRNNFGITESRYLEEVMPAFFSTNEPTRFYPIQPNRMEGICQPTVALMARFGISLNQ